MGLMQRLLHVSQTPIVGHIRNEASIPTEHRSQYTRKFLKRDFGKDHQQSYHDRPASEFSPETWVLGESGKAHRLPTKYGHV
jgi:hypothetical protein